MRIIDFVVPMGGRSGVETVVNKVGIRLVKQGFCVRVVQMTSDGFRWMDDLIEFYPLLINQRVERVEDFIGMYAAFLNSHEKPSVVIATPWPFMACVARTALEMVGLRAKKGCEIQSHDVSCQSDESGMQNCNCMSATEVECDNNINVISWLHGPIETYKKYGTGGLECISYADCFLALTKRAAIQVETFLPNIRTEVVGNPVAMKGAHVVECWNRGVRNLKYVGRLSEEKRVDVVIEALGKTKDRWTLSVFGAGDDEARLRELAEAGGVADCIVWNGWKDNPWESYADVTALVIASDYEGFCMAAVEALARGIPVISTPVDGIIEFVKPGVNGYLYSKGNADELAQILDLIATGVLPEINPAECAQSVAQYEEEAVLDNIVNIAEDIIQGLKS